MLFNSFQFIVFFPIVIAVYYIIPAKIRYVWLLLASYYFYMSWNVKYALLLLGSTVITYIASLLTDRFRNRKKVAKLCVAGSVVLNFAMLIIFKYLGFIFSSLSKVTGVIGMNIAFPAVNLLLPVGISFYIFQAVGYTIDVYRNDRPEKNFFRYALFVSFFPQLVAGPIERSKNLLSQLRSIDNGLKPSLDELKKGALIMLYGYIMKMIVADRISMFVDVVFDERSYSYFKGFSILLTAVLFSIQIYCDFAGYTYIAIGSARMMGIKLMRNFNTPYLALNIKDFWNRWHISLTSWFRDYLYFPLGGSRKGKFRKYVNIMIVFLVSGLWHGASWHYVAWGFIHGIMRVIGEIAELPRKIICEKLKLRTDTFATKALKTTVTFLLVSFAWVFFRASSTRQAVDMLRSMVTHWNPWVLFDSSLINWGLDPKEWNVLVLGLLLIAVVDIFRRKGKDPAEMIVKQNTWFYALIMYVGIISVVVFGIYGETYNATKFIYFAF